MTVGDIISKFKRKHLPKNKNIYSSFWNLSKLLGLGKDATLEDFFKICGIPVSQKISNERISANRIEKKTKKEKISNQEFLQYLDKTFLYQWLIVSLREAIKKTMEKEWLWITNISEVFLIFNKQLPWIWTPICPSLITLNRMFFGKKMASKKDFMDLFDIKNIEQISKTRKVDIIGKTDSIKSSPVDSYHESLDIMLYVDEYDKVNMEQAYRFQVENFLNTEEDKLVPPGDFNKIILHKEEYDDIGYDMMYDTEEEQVTRLGSSMSQYKRDIKYFSSLNDDEHIALIKKIRETEDEWIRMQTKEHLIHSMLGLVYMFARKIARKNSIFELNDVIQEGNIGLMIAIEKFDINYGSSFMSYALSSIRNHMLSIYTQESIIYFPKYIYTDKWRVEKTKEEMLIPDNFSREDINKISFLLEIAPSIVEAILHWPHKILSTNIALEDDLTLEDIFPSKTIDWPEESLQIAQIKQFVTNKLLGEGISNVARTIIRNRIGLNSEPQTLEEIAITLSLTRERVRQIQAETLEKLQKRCRAHGVLPFTFMTD